MVKNKDYFKGTPNIDTIIFKILPDDNVKALQLRSGELDLAMLTPKDTKLFEGDSKYTIYNMLTADYREILYNFNHSFWQENRELIPAFNYAIDRQVMVDSVLLGEGWKTTYLYN